MQVNTGIKAYKNIASMHCVEHPSMHEKELKNSRVFCGLVQVLFQHTRVIDPRRICSIDLLFFFCQLTLN